MSTVPKLSTACSTIALISTGWIMFAGEKTTSPDPPSATELTAASICASSPRPLTMPICR
jgi:hypothetical protein